MLGVAVALALGLEDVVRDLVDLGTAALQNVGAAVDHGVQQLHQHHLTGDGRRAGAGELGLDQGERLGQVITHRHQAVVAEDEGHRRGPGHEAQPRTSGQPLRHDRELRSLLQRFRLTPAVVPSRCSFFDLSPGRSLASAVPTTCSRALGRNYDQVNLQLKII